MRRWRITLDMRRAYIDATAKSWNPIQAGARENIKQTDDDGKNDSKNTQTFGLPRPQG